MSNAVRRRRVPGRTSTTLVDVASAAGVSTASVSRALARPDIVSDDLRLRVLRAATTLGYVPNVAARALVSQRSGLVGVVLGDPGGLGVAAALRSLDLQLNDAGWALILRHCASGVGSAAHALTLLQRGVDALVFLGVDVSPDLRRVPGLEGLPCVSVDRADDSAFIASAGLDLRRGYGLAVDYLAQLGHRHLAIVFDEDQLAEAFSDNARPSAGGASVTVERLNLGHASLADAVLGRLELPRPPTAVICGSDALAVGMLHACAAQGIDVPGRLSLVGMGDTLLARGATPTLASLRIPAASAGTAAADYLLARFAGRAYFPVELPVKLVVRGSTGPAP
jgi:LacI family transcriptional regulator